MVANFTLKIETPFPKELHISQWAKNIHVRRIISPGILDVHGFGRVFVTACHFVTYIKSQKLSGINVIEVPAK